MVTFKYLKKRHLILFRESGTIRLGSLYKYREIENKAIQDKYEGRIIHKIEPKEKSKELTSEEAIRMLPHLQRNKGMTILPGAHLTREDTVPGAFIFCTSCVIDKKLMEKWNYDSYYRIVDIAQFAKTIFEELSKNIPLQDYRHRKVRYEEKEIDVTNNNLSECLRLSNDPWDNYFRKPEAFRNEKEYRLVFLPTSDFTMTEYFDLHCKKLLTCCKF